MMDSRPQDEGSLDTGEDTHDLIQRKRNNQGRHECEVLDSAPGAAEGAYEWDNCSKNPGHQNFIPAPEFSLEHLPEWCRRKELFEYLQRVSALTVKLRVGYTSWDRPDGYTFSDVRGTRIVHTGSGLIVEMKPGTGPCPCHECASSRSPQQTWHEVGIETACHVVYNAEEARCTRVDVFYDDEAARRDGRMKTIWGIKGGGSIEDDSSYLICATHDADLAEQLKVHLDKSRIVFQQQVLASPYKNWRNLCVIVSHPHGRSKKVTVGEMKSLENCESQLKFIYDTATCPGSSGATVPVIEFIRVVGGVHWKTDMNWVSTHSEGLRGGLNSSGFSPKRVAEFFTPVATRAARFVLWLFG